MGGGGGGGVNSAVARNILVGVQNISFITVRSELVSVVSFMSHRIPTYPLNNLLFTILYVSVHDFEYLIKRKTKNTTLSEHFHNQ